LIVKIDEYLKRNDLNEKKMFKLNQDANSLNVKSDLEIENIKDIIFSGRFLQFEKNKFDMNRSVLGEFYEINMKSFILKEKPQIKDLMILCEFNLDQKWNCIYRAS